MRGLHIPVQRPVNNTVVRLANLNKAMGLSRMGFKFWRPNAVNRASFFHAPDLQGEPRDLGSSIRKLLGRSESFPCELDGFVHSREFAIELFLVCVR